MSAIVAAEKVLAAFAGTFTAAGADVTVGASVGIALFPQHGGDAGELLRAADVAMYSAKRTRKGIAVYHDSLDPKSVAWSDRVARVLVARGMTNGEIAAHLFLSEGTVKTHVKRIFAKLALHDRTQAVILAYEVGLVRPGDSAAE